ncbi:MAG: class I SAM-dependent methyltransferase [Smithella sp.]
MIECSLDIKQLSEVAITGLITALCHAIESRSEEPILHDPKAEAVADRLVPLLKLAPDALLRLLTQGTMFGLCDMMIAGIALRARKYDECARNFAAGNKGSGIINLGCGLDTRFWRIDDGCQHFYDLDLPEIISLKKQLADDESDRYHMIGTSVLDYQWMDQLADEKLMPCLFLAEGLFMYLPPDEVRRLLIELQERFPGSELLCDVAPLWLISPAAQLISKVKGWSAQYQFGVRHSREFEEWDSGLHFIDEWFYLDEDEPRLGFLRAMYKWKLILRDIWTVHYMLGSKRS